MHSTLFSTTSSLTSLPPRSLTLKATSTTSSSPPQPTLHKLNKYSSLITEPKSRGGSQAVLYGVGLSDSDMSKPQIGISSVWYEGNTCNMHPLGLVMPFRKGPEACAIACSHVISLLIVLRLLCLLSGMMLTSPFLVVTKM